MLERANILKMSKSIKVLVKIKMCLLLYGKNHKGFLANPIIFTITYERVLLISHFPDEATKAQTGFN